jgi:alpha-galactosidase
MSDTEYKTHMSLWSILAAPLLAGNDLRSMSPSILAILTNKEVIAINQDKDGKQGTRVLQSGEQEVWRRQLSGGAQAVAIFNRAAADAKVTIKWADIGISEKSHLRDLWLHQDVEWQGPEFSATIPGHGVVLLRVNH